MLMKNNMFLAPLLVGALFSPLTFGAEETTNLEDFSELRLGSGIEATVSCGDSSSITLRGSEEALKTVKINDNGNRLKLGRKMTSIFGKSRDAKIEADIVSARSLTQIGASTGSSIDLAACAISKNEVDVKVSTGAEVTAAGETEVLELDVGTGGNFDAGRKDDAMKIGKAYVSLSTGSTARLCGVKEVEGKASTGASIRIHKETEYDLKFGTGASVSTSGC